MIGAFNALPVSWREALEPQRPLLPQVGNYPDYFDDPSKPDEKKDAIDPEWRRFCLFPSGMEAKCLHHWPHSINEQNAFRPVIEYWLQQAIDAYRANDAVGFVKFIGCLSHYEGDVTQPAHLLNHFNYLTILREMMPPPSTMSNFDYHVDLERVTGICGPLEPARLLGTSVVEAAWRLAAWNAQAVSEMRRYILPTLQAIFDERKDEAQRLAEPPVTRAGQFTLDLFCTALRLATGDIPEAEKETLARGVDLRVWKADAESHDLVYGGSAILDGSRPTPPAGAPIIPARLRFEDGIRTVRGLGVLPHSGVAGPRECWLRYGLPRGVFTRFEATVGMHSEETGEGAAEFIVELDSQPQWRSGRRTAQDWAMPISLELGASETITLKVVDANEGRTFWKNHAIWAEPVLLKQEARS